MNAANIATDVLRIDTSGNREFRVLTSGRRITVIKLRDIPAKVRFLSGKESDVYKNDQYYPCLGEPIAPIIDVIPTLVITVDKSTHVFFGGGIDLDDAETTYRALFEVYNQFHAAAEKKKPAISLPAIRLPKLSMPAINLQLPFRKDKADPGPEESLPAAECPTGLSSNEANVISLDNNTNEVK